MLPLLQHRLLLPVVVVVFVVDLRRLAGPVLLLLVDPAALPVHGDLQHRVLLELVLGDVQVVAPGGGALALPAVGGLRPDVVHNGLARVHVPALLVPARVLQKGRWGGERIDPM
jgi:hypothetical protein